MIRFNQPKYIVPLIALPFFYVFFYLFHGNSFGQKPIQLVQTDALNLDIPDPVPDRDDLKDKFDAFLEAHKSKRDFSAIQEIDNREEKTKAEEMYVDSMQMTETTETAPYLPTVPKQIKNGLTTEIPDTPTVSHITDSEQYVSGAYTMKKPLPVPKKEMKETDYEKQMLLFKAQMSYVDSLFREDGEMGKSVDAEMGGRGNAGMGISGDVSPTASLRRPKEKESVLPVHRMKKRHGAVQTAHFNTIVKEKTDLFIRAMIDEGLNIIQDSRVRIRLLEDVAIGGVDIKRGCYLYGTVTSFKPQRIEIQVRSVLIEDQILDIALDIYDADGMKGLYVPASKFRELAKTVTGDMIGSGGQNIGNSPGNQMELVYGMAKDAFNTTTKVAAKAIKKNKAKLKYSTIVFLVNSQNKPSNNFQTGMAGAN